MTAYSYKTFLALGVSFAALAAVAPASAQDTPPTPQAETSTPPAQPSDRGGLEEIIVTAQKREQNLMTVPVSVTALTAESIRANRITNVLDLSAIAPNLTVRSSPGGANTPTFVLRGEFAAPSTPGFEKQVGYYLDGVYISGGGGTAFDLGNISRIEVLRGPQGTLFGQNATAGAIAIYTTDPSGKFGGTIDASLGNYAEKRIRVGINTPKVGPFSAYFAYEHFERDGDIKNLGAGTVFDYRAVDPQLGLAKSPRYLGSVNRETVQAALKFDNGGDVTATYKFLWIDNNSTPEAIGFLDLNTPGLCGFQTCAPGSLGANLNLLRQQNPTYFQRVLKRPDAINNSFTLPSYFKNVAHIFTAQWKATDRLAFKNTFGYLKNHEDTTQQLDGLGGLLNTVPALGPVNQPITIYTTTGEQRNKQWSDEFQVNFNSRLLTLTAGYLHFDYKGSTAPRDYQPGGINEKASYTPVAIFNDFVAPGSTAGQFVGVHTVSDAVYTQAEIHVTPKLDVIGGLRYTWDDKSSVTDNLAVPVSLRTSTYKDSRPSFSVGLAYKANQDVFLFAKYSQGYLAGGAYGGLLAKPEIAKSWEGGVKAELFDRRARVALTLFHAKYTNVQSIQAGSTIAANINFQAGCIAGSGHACPGDPYAAVGSAIANSYDLRAQGFEFEATAAPLRRLTLGLGVGFTDAKITKIAPLFLTPYFGYDPYFRSKWTINGNVQYDTPELFGDAFLRMRVDVVYRSSYDLSVRNYTPFLAGLRAPATAVVNGRVALTNIELGGTKLELAGWVRNLTNEHSISYALTTPYVFAATYDQARTFGLDARLEF